MKDDARMFGSLAGERHDVPISGTSRHVAASAPADAAELPRARFSPCAGPRMPRSRQLQKRCAGYGLLH